MTDLKKPAGPPTYERILDAATHLFAKYGYYGVSTREIANAAQVNEVTVFRYYPHKHDLYVAVVKSGLEQLQLRGDLLNRIAEAGNSRMALVRTFELIEKTLMQRPELLRLLQYRALDLGEEFDPLVRAHLGELVVIVARYLEPWVRNGELQCKNTKIVVLALISIVISYGSLQRVFQGEEFSLTGMFESCAEMYSHRN